MVIHVKVIVMLMLQVNWIKLVMIMFNAIKNVKERETVAINAISYVLIVKKENLMVILKNAKIKFLYNLVVGI